MCMYLGCFSRKCMSPCTGQKGLNPLPDDKMLEWSKLKACADDKLNLAVKLKFVLGMVENIVGKGENAGYFSHNFFKRFLF